MLKAIRGFYGDGKVSLEEDVGVKKGDILVIFLDKEEEDVMTEELFKAKMEVLEEFKRGEAIEWDEYLKEAGEFMKFRINRVNEGISIEFVFCYCK